MEKNGKNNINKGPARIIWKKRPSEIRAYNRTLYTTADNMDYLRVDYNLKNKRVRLYVEIAGEGGNPYYSVITDGEISSKRNVSSGRTGGFSDRFEDRAGIFSSIDNKDVLKLINRNYGISIVPAKGDLESSTGYLLKETRRKYFQPEMIPSAGISPYQADEIKKIRFIDFIDLLVGLLISGLLFYFLHYSFTAMGIAAAFFGIIIGMVDMVFRDRPPVFLKIIFFIITGTVSYVYGYLY